MQIILCEIVLSTKKCIGRGNCRDYRNEKITKAVSLQMSGVKSATEDTVSIVQKIFLIFPKFLNINLDKNSISKVQVILFHPFHYLATRYQRTGWKQVRSQTR